MLAILWYETLDNIWPEYGNLKGTQGTNNTTAPIPP